MQPSKRIWAYDTTLRDGSQGEGVDFSLMDKLAIAQRLDDIGMTRRRGILASDDIGMKSLVNARPDAITVVGKSWDMQATEVLGVDLAENIQMIRDSVAYLASEVGEVVYDAEHYFDGWKANPDYALQTIAAAAESGARWIALCHQRWNTA
jgi:2-isopropylmalate synthase